MLQLESSRTRCEQHIVLLEASQGSISFRFIYPSLQQKPKRVFPSSARSRLHVPVVRPGLSSSSENGELRALTRKPQALKGPNDAHRVSAAAQRGDISIDLSGLAPVLYRHVKRTVRGLT